MVRDGRRERSEDGEMREIKKEKETEMQVKIKGSTPRDKKGGDAVMEGTEKRETEKVEGVTVKSGL